MVLGGRRGGNEGGGGLLVLPGPRPSPSEAPGSPPPWPEPGCEWRSLTLLLLNLLLETNLLHRLQVLILLKALHHLLQLILTLLQLLLGILKRKKET
ncbi:Moesin/ezrin/radixin -like protein 1like [Caligus rogercresseyi]|uniref:Moesin/ezrin/radixin -like protein 1like n=1 Tax=Caligus rogercresseyi TaxID=217165 RepID=A0A7T8HFH7_CALRO|nr:Moesin/ezrin/radixin -like protein 1like [Caligus rogercresseyi]